MMYCFLTASLPTLNQGAYPELSVADFDATAKPEMSDKAFAALTSWDRPDAEELPPVYAAMRRFDAFLHWRIAGIRAEKLGRNSDFPVPEEFFGEVDFTLPAALSAPDPVERERAVDEARWRKMDDLEAGHEMDFEHLCVYRLRLLALQKFARRSESVGKNNFATALEKLSGAFGEP